jgi:hypothetical protein
MSIGIFSHLAADSIWLEIELWCSKGGSDYLDPNKNW